MMTGAQAIVILPNHGLQRAVQAVLDAPVIAGANACPEDDGLEM